MLCVQHVNWSSYPANPPPAPGPDPASSLSWRAAHISVLCEYEARHHHWGNLYSATTRSMRFFSDGRVANSSTVFQASFGVRRGRAGGAGTVTVFWDFWGSAEWTTTDNGETFTRTYLKQNKRNRQVTRVVEMRLVRRSGPTLLELLAAGVLPWCS